MINFHMFPLLQSPPRGVSEAFSKAEEALRNGCSDPQRLKPPKVPRGSPGALGEFVGFIGDLLGIYRICMIFFGGLIGDL